MISQREWLVLFGGSGRESSIQTMLLEGVRIKAVVVPQNQNVRLKNSILKIRSFGCEIIEVNRVNLAENLLYHRACSLLSIGFPYLIDGRLLDCFSLAINVHPTLLPSYRGPTSGAHILINGEKESGATVHLMTAEMDKGAILAQSRVKLSPFDTVRSLQRKVYETEPVLITDAIRSVELGLVPVPQDESLASEYPRKRKPSDSEIDPSLSILDLFDQIRACNPEEYPAFFYYKGEKVCIKLWRPEKPDEACDEI